MAKSVRLLSVTKISVSLQKSNPPTLLVSVDGTAATPGYTNIRLEKIERELSPDRIFDLALLGDPPTGIVPQVVRPVTVDVVIDEKYVDQIIAITVHARTNQLTEFLISDPTGPVPAGDGMPFPWPHPWSAGGGKAQAFPTTLAIGEEHQPTTFAFGEEHFPTTLAWGEEGHHPTSFAIGEEGPHTLFLPGEGNKPFFGETDPRVDDPLPPWTTLPGTNPFGKR